MKNTMTVYDFCMDKTIQESFSHEASIALFDYLEMTEDETGIEFEFDPIALRCEFSEYETVEDALTDHGFESADEFNCVIHFDGGVIVSNI